MEYFSFDLNVRKKVNGCYPVNARSETFGESEEIQCTSFDSPEFIAACKKFYQGNNDTDFFNSFGELLFNSLFLDGIKDLYRTCVGEVGRDDQKGFRIRLGIEPPEISVIPWELIYDRRRDCFLATSSETPLTRYISISEPIKELKAELPIRILVMIPSGSGLDVEKEKEIVTKAVGHLKEVVQLNILEGSVTRSDISQILIKEKYHILHFIGHGVFHQDEGYLVINSETNLDEPEPISSKAFAGYFKDYPWMKLVVLNSCQGAEVSKVKPLAGMAPQLVRKGIPAVIAMQDSIPDAAAILFAREFYSKLCVGWNRGRVDVAISHARNRMEMDFPETATFALPVLFMRSPKGVIFDVDFKPDNKSVLPPIQNIHRLMDVEKTHQKNLQLLKTIEKENPGTAAVEIEKETKQIATVRNKLRKYYVTVGIILLASFTIFLASFVGLLNIVFLRLDNWTESKFLAFTDAYIKKNFDPNIKLILKNNPDGNGTDNERVQLRCRNAEIIHSLSQVNAEVVVLDIELNDPWPSCDEKLGNAIKEANARGTTVILGAKNFKRDQVNPFRIVPETISSLQPYLEEKNWALLRCGFFPKLQLAKRLSDKPGWIDAEEVQIAPCMPLQAVMQSEAHKSSQNLTAFYNRKERKIQLRNSEGQLKRSISVEDSKMYITVSLTSSDEMDPHDYDLIGVNSSDPRLLEEYKGSGKIVVIGYKADDDQYGDRFGVEYQAAAISNLLQEDFGRPLPWKYHFLFILIMYLIGLLMQSKLRQWMRLKIPISLLSFVNKDVHIPLSLIIVVVLYFTIAFFLFRQTRILLDFNYHILALLVGYWTAAWIQKGVSFKKVKNT